MDDPTIHPLDATPILEAPLCTEQPTILNENITNCIKNSEYSGDKDPSTYLALLFPWMAQHGMCIMPIPIKQKQSTVKKARNWSRELQKLQSSINYEKGASSSNVGGIGSVEHI